MPALPEIVELLALGDRSSSSLSIGGVDARDEHAGHRGDLVDRLPALTRSSRPSMYALRRGVVLVDREEQRDVDVDAGGDRRRESPPRLPACRGS